MRYEVARGKSGPWLWVGKIVLLLLALLIIGTSVRSFWGGATLFYEITPSELVISFGPQTTTIDHDLITGVTVIEEPSEARRIVGTSVPGLKEGRWSFAETGPITLFATDVQPLTVVESEAGKWGINPADPAGFKAALESRQSGRFSPQSGDNPWRLIVLAAIPIVGIGVTGTAWLRLTRIAREIGYELGPDTVRIYGGSRPIEIPFSSIKDVKLASPAGRPARLFGTSIPGLYWGAFSWRSVGRRLRLYATQLDPLVVISTGDRNFGISPKDADRFVDDLKGRIPS